MKRLIVCAAALALQGTLVQAEGFMPWTDVFAKADLNGDGGVSMAEVMDHRIGEDFVGFQPWMSDHFAALDTDGDGIVTKEEIAAGMKAMNVDDAALSRAFFESTGFMPKSH